jgi:hypothetical protein
VLTADQAAIVKGLLARGEKQHDIAAFFGENGGRIAEIAKGKKHKDVKPAAKKDLPTPAALAGSYAVHQARQAIIRAKLGLDAALAYLDEQEAGP